MKKNIQSPVQLVNIDKEGQCYLTQEAEDFLKNINRNLGVIVVSGLYRTGKSYLLNRIIGRQHGFEIGSSTLSCTKGLWIWGETVFLKDKNLELLFIDTEGLGSAFDDRNETIDMQIFCLSMLLSSYFIYNCLKNIDQSAIESLSMVSSFAKKIQNKYNNLSSYSQNYPSFLCVIRDFSFTLVDSKGKKISTSQYLEKALEEDESANSDDQIENNEIKKTLKEFFKDRDCYTLVRPVNDEEQLRNIDKLDYNELRKEFKEQMKTLVSKIYESVNPKIVQGSYVNGQMFLDLLKQYIEAINCNAIPDVKTSWKIVLDNQTKDYLSRVNY